MAMMFHGGIEEFGTYGERDFYRFIERCAKPDSDFRCWYEPNLRGLKPDFVLFGREIGLLVLEVKDWNIKQIEHMGQKGVDIYVTSEIVKRKNPYYQADHYKDRLLELIQKEGRLISKEQEYYGKSRVPVGIGVVLPNIERASFIKAGFGDVIPPERIYFLDDLHPEAAICKDTDGHIFRKEVARRFKPLFHFELKHKEIEHLGEIIAPERRGCLPPRGKSPDYKDLVQRIYDLDNNQVFIARRFLEGHHIFEGPSGCGKTLVLAHKADLLMKYVPGIKRILFVCYNITLVNYIRRLLMTRGTPLGSNGVEVMHIYELCKKVLGEDVSFEGEDSETYEFCLEEALERLPVCGLKYDAILIDEGQGFSDDMYALVRGLLNEKTNSLTVALDDNQQLYKNTSSWKEKGIAAQGRVHRLHHVYRNTKEIVDFASCFCALPRTVGTADSDQPELVGNYYLKSGPKPVLQGFADVNDCIGFIGDSIDDLIRREVFSPSEVAVLYTKSTLAESIHIPAQIEEALSARGILSSWITESTRTKRSYDITTEQVAISTVHSAKGMDYGCVFLLGLDHLDGSRWSQRQINNMIYVSITRARYQLYALYCDETETIRKVKLAHKAGRPTAST